VKNIRARIGIVATGSNIRLLRKLNWSAKKKPSAVGFRCYLRSSFAIDRLVFSFDKSIVPGYAWIFPLGNHEYNIGCGMPLGRDLKRIINFKRVFNNFIDEFPLNRFRKSRYAKEILAGIVAEISDPQEIFSLKGIFKTFWE
jgi:flavin-dependent dehydrogenase